MRILTIVFCFFSSHLLFAQSTSSPLPPMTDWFLSTGDWYNDPQLYVRELGNANKVPVIMLHGGWGGNYSGLTEAVKNLTDDHRFILYDQRGSLRSPCPDSLISFDNHIKDLERLRQELNVEEMTIVGHSMGAVLASAYAAQYPKRVKKLILLAPAYLKNPVPEKDFNLMNKQREKHQAYMNRPEVTNQLKKHALNSENTTLSSKENTAAFRINFAKRMLYDIEKWPYLTGGRALYKGHVYSLTEASYPKDGWDYFSDFSKHKIPVAIIAGDHDFLDFGNGLITTWKEDAPTIQLSIIPDAGHIIWIDQPIVFSKEMKKALSD